MQMHIDIEDANDLVTGAWEPCEAHAGATPVCVRCGWLDAEHTEVAVAAVRRSGASQPTSPASSRRASRAA